MLFTIDRDSLLNKLKIVERVTAQRGNVQPVLANVLFEAQDNTLNLSATDLEISVKARTTAAVKKEGKITLPAKKLLEIAAKLPDKPVEFSLNEDTNVVNISCGNSKFEIIGISAQEFPKIEDDISNGTEIEIELEPLLKSIKNTVYAAANYENRNVISGVFCLIKDTKLEMAATDGNRLTRIIETIKNKDTKNAKLVIPSKTLNEFVRICSFINEEKVVLIVDKSKLTFKTMSFSINSRLIEGEYPPYEQLIPKTTANNSLISKDDLIIALDRVSTMVNERTSIVKFMFNENKLLLKAETPNSGTSEDIIDCNYTGEELAIAFNYKYVLDSIKTMDSQNVKIGLNGSLSATMFEPDSEENYICLIMPIQIR
ncbi:MAG: DNA polymerase III subunit beta [Candidatus Gastranaerophilales bacterium]|nr:DNA polymerase III subunit beta [Candidatus Gastranaerophilales bacterium]